MTRFVFDSIAEFIRYQAWEMNAYMTSEIHRALSTAQKSVSLLHLEGISDRVPGSIYS